MKKHICIFVCWIYLEKSLSRLFTFAEADAAVFKNLWCPLDVKSQEWGWGDENEEAFAKALAMDAAFPGDEYKEADGLKNLIWCAICSAWDQDKEEAAAHTADFNIKFGFPACDIETFCTGKGAMWAGGLGICEGEELHFQKDAWPKALTSRKWANDGACKIG